MRNFKENDKIIFVNGEYFEHTGIIKGSAPNRFIKLDNGENVPYNLYTEKYMQHIEEYEANAEIYFSEMSTVARDAGLNISVDNELAHLSIAYFKVYDHSSARKARRVARLHFKDSGMEHHKDTLGKNPWILNSKDNKKIIDVLKRPYKNNEEYTNWQILCYQWNWENDLIPQDMKGYFKGGYDYKYNNTNSRLKEAYVPSNLEMPEKWVYDPQK